MMVAPWALVRAWAQVAFQPLCTLWWRGGGGFSGGGGNMGYGGGMQECSEELVAAAVATGGCREWVDHSMASFRSEGRGCGMHER